MRYFKTDKEFVDKYDELKEDFKNKIKEYEDKYNIKIGNKSYPKRGVKIVENNNPKLKLNDDKTISKRSKLGKQAVDEFYEKVYRNTHLIEETIYLLSKNTEERFEIDYNRVRWGLGILTILTPKDDVIYFCTNWDDINLCPKHFTEITNIEFNNLKQELSKKEDENE